MMTVKKGTRPILYFVTVMRKPEKGVDGRCWGYYFDLDSAKEAIKSNITDIHECAYDLAVIETVSEGIPSQMEDIQWYSWKWNEGYHGGNYIECDKPDRLKNIKHFALG